MSRNGSGTYNLPAGNPVVTGTTITTTWANSTLNDIASALTGSVAADGQTPMSGNLNMANNKIVSVTDPTSAQDAATKAYADALIAGTKTGVFTSVTDLGLTSGRVTYATTAGLLTDSANLTFDGTYLTANSIKDSALTSGRVTYATTSGLLTDSSNFTFDGTTLRAPNLQGPTFAAYQSSNQTLATNTDTKIQFQTEEWDTDSAFDSTTNYRFTPQVAGYYQVNAALNAGAAPNYIGIIIRKNGTAYKTGNNAGNSGLATVSSLVYLNGSTDYIEIWGNFSSGQVTGTGISQTYFNAAMVRSA